jgi:hypothetical protein
MARTQIVTGRMVFPNGAVVDRAEFDDGTKQWTVTPGRQSDGAPMPPGFPNEFPGAAVNPPAAEVA